MVSPLFRKLAKKYHGTETILGGLALLRNRSVPNFISGFSKVLSPFLSYRFWHAFSRPLEWSALVITLLRWIRSFLWLMTSGYSSKRRAQVQSTGSHVDLTLAHRSWYKNYHLTRAESHRKVRYGVLVSHMGHDMADSPINQYINHLWKKSAEWLTKKTVRPNGWLKPRTG